MRRIAIRTALVAAIAAAAGFAAAATNAAVARAGDESAARLDAFQETFSVEPADLSSTGRNAYFILEPGYRLSFAGTEDGEDATLVVTVLEQTRIVAGVETRVVEERESAGGQITEVSRNYFAISTRTSDVFYFGEDVDTYRDGKIAGHEGSWLAGERDSRFGLMMPGTVRVGLRYGEEVAPGTAMDRAEVVSVSETMTTPAGKFKQVLKVKETSPLEPGAKEYKYYAPGIGLIRDGNLRLVESGMGARPIPPQ